MMANAGRCLPGAGGDDSTALASSDALVSPRRGECSPLLSPVERPKQSVIVPLEDSSSGTEILRANTSYPCQLTVGEYLKQGFVGTPI